MKKPIILSVVFILLLGVSTGGVWYWQNSEKTKQQQENQNKVSTLETAKSNLEKDKAELEKKVEETEKTTMSSSQGTTTASQGEIDQIKVVCIVGKDEVLNPLVYVENDNGKFADCGIGQKNGPGGGHVFLKKINNAWTKIWEGNGDPTEQDIEKYKIPHQIYPESKY